MIDPSLIESAKIIRKEFLKLNSNLDIYNTEVKKLADFLLEKVEKITEYKDNKISKIKSKDDLSEVVSHLVVEIQSIEDEEERLRRKVEEINTKIEKLRIDEKNLYDAIKKRYPNLTDKQIVQEIHPHLEK